jgi:hypothetical protein
MDRFAEPVRPHLFHIDHIVILVRADPLDGHRDNHNDAGSVRVSIEGKGSPPILASKPRNR